MSNIFERHKKITGREKFEAAEAAEVVAMRERREAAFRAAQERLKAQQKEKGGTAEKAKDLTDLTAELNELMSERDTERGKEKGGSANG